MPSEKQAKGQRNNQEFDPRARYYVSSVFCQKGLRNEHFAVSKRLPALRTACSKLMQSIFVKQSSF